MLRKLPETRPTLSRVEQVLTGVLAKPHDANVPDPFSALAHAGAQVAEAEQQRQAQIQKVNEERSARVQLARSAFEILAENIERLWGKVHASAPTAKRTSGRHSRIFSMQLGEGVLAIEFIQADGAMASGQFPQSGWDVIAASELAITDTKTGFQWGASLWYSRIKEGQAYRWREIGYRQQFGRSVISEPFACKDFNDADLAASKVMHTVALAYGPWPIDDEEEEAFHSRCAWLLARAAAGGLRQPRQLPIETWPPSM